MTSARPAGTANDGISDALAFHYRYPRKEAMLQRFQGAATTHAASRRARAEQLLDRPRHILKSYISSFSQDAATRYSYFSGAAVDASADILPPVFYFADDGEKVPKML